jgi:seryl-tRNA synthetase
MILAPVYTQTLHEGLQRSWEMRDKAALENSLLLKAQMEHTQKTLEGLAHKIRNLQKQIDGEDIKEKNKVIRLISKNDEIPS